mgnify:FL=1
MLKWGFKAYYALRKRGFDIYDFADSYREEEIDTESYTIIEPAMNFFENLQVPKRLT